MKKIIINIVIFLVGFNLNAQENPPLDPLDGYEAVKTIPPSPEAAALGNFGNIPVGLYSGTAKHSVPLYVVEGRNISVPITLNYSTNGIRVDEICTWTGTGWTLDAGGVITRTVKGQRDDLEIREVPKMNQECLTYDEFISFESADTEHDVYSFSFMGNSGKFIIFDNEIKQFEQSGLRIEIFTVTSPYRFVITDTKGIKYYFGGINEDGKKAVEFTVMDEGPSNDTAWYLSKIVDVSGEEIIFDYLVEQTFYSYNTNYSESQESLAVNYPIIPLYGPVYNSALLLSPVSGVSVEVECSPPTQIIYRSTSVKNNGVYLSKVYVKDGIDFVNFDSQLRNHPSYSTLRKLKSINGLNKKIDLNIVENKWYRMYLKDISFKSLENNEYQKHRFDYNDEETIPLRESKSIDYWGYFNGEINSRLLRGKRNPNPDFGQNGTLKTIHYPTGGRTEITYEGHCSTSMGLLGCISNEDFMFGWFTGKQYSLHSTTDNFTYEFIHFSLPPTNGNPNQNIVFTFSGKYTIPQPNINGATIGKCKFSLVNDDGVVFQLNYTHDINNSISYQLPPGNYTLSVGVKSSIYMASVRFQYCSEFSDQIIEIKNFVGGVRVKEIKDINFDEDIISHKKYEYAEEILSYPDIQKYIYKTSNISGSILMFATFSAYFPYCVYLLKTSNGELKGRVTEQHFFYGKVSEIVVGLEKEIETIHHFKSNIFNLNNSTYLENLSFAFHNYINNAPQSNIIGGPVEIKTEYYKTDPISGNKKIVKRVENEVFYDILNYFPSFIVEKISGQVNLPYTYSFIDANGQQLECMDIAHLQNLKNIWRYFNIAYRIKRKETKITEFSHNGSSYPEDLIVRSEEFYENPVHNLLTKLNKETSVSEPGFLNVSKKESIKYFYPTDVINPSATSTFVGGDFDLQSMTSLQNMIQTNIVATPVQIETYSNENYPISTQRTLYKAWDFTIESNNGIATNTLNLPYKIQALKGQFDITTNPFENRVEISRYSLFGQILETQNAFGPPISYVYGYNNRYVVAVAENATYSQIEALNNQPDENNVSSIVNQLTDAQVSVFKYQPKVGMIYKQLPNGFNTSYKYDEFGRLIEIKEGKYITIEKGYNYKH